MATTSGRSTDSAVLSRLDLHLASMIALEVAIARQVASIGADRPAADHGGSVVILLRELETLAQRHHAALGARRDNRGNGAPRGEEPAPTSAPGDLGAGRDRASAALFALHASMSQAVLGYAVLMELANRAADNPEGRGTPNTADLAREHMRHYAAMVRRIERTMPRVVVDELAAEGRPCECVCPACGLGVCLCWLAFRRQLALAWADAGSLDDLDGIQLVPPRPGSAAERAGLRGGDVLRSVDGAPIDSLPSLQAAISGHAAGEEIAFTVERHGGEHERVTVERS